MNKHLLRILAVISVTTITSTAAANYYDPGFCYIRCWNGTTAGPYLSTPESCCEDLQNVCAGNGEAYTEYFGGTPFQTRLYCLSGLPE